MWEGITDFEQFLGRHRKKPDVVKATQEPRRTRQKGYGRVVRIPHLQGASDELVSTRPLHTVHAEVRAANADRVFRRPGTRRIILRGHQAMPRIEGRRHGRAEIDIAQPQHDVACIEDDALHVIYGMQPIDAANELDIARAPRCVRSYRLRVLAHRQLRGWIVPGEREMEHTHGQRDILQDW